MRIAFISAGDFAHVGLYLDHFRDVGHDVHFIALSPSPPRRVPTYDVGVGGRIVSDADKWRYLLGMLRARRLIRRLRPDVVHAHYATSGGLGGLVCGHRPTIVTAHGTDLTEGMRSPLRRTLLKAVFGGATCVNTVSSDLTGMALSLGVARDKIVELTPGIDTVRFAPGAWRQPRGPLRLICTRRLEPAYDPRTIVEALSIVKRNGIEFKMTFAGVGLLREELEAMAGRLGLAGEVVFLGEVGGGDMPALLRDHDVYLSASRADGASLSLLEAMATDLFPIVSRIPANEAWLKHGTGCILHRVGDPSDLAACVMKFSQAPLAATDNRAKVLSRGDRATNMRRLEMIYRTLSFRAVDARR